MGKSVNDNVLDAALSYLGTNGTRVDICTQEPTTYAEATSTYSKGYKSSPGWTGPADGSASGRKISMDAITDGIVTADGTVTHIAVSNGVDSLLYVTTVATSKAVVSGSAWTLTAWAVEIADPT